MIDELEIRRLVVRTRCRGDRRVVLLAVTQQGEDAVRNALPHVHALWNSVFEPFGQVELQHLLDAMERLAHALEQHMSIEPKAGSRSSKPSSWKLVA